MENQLLLITRALGAAQSRVQDCLLQINSYADADEFLESDVREEVLEQASAALKASTTRALAAIRIVFELLHLKESLKALEGDFGLLVDTLGVVNYYDQYSGPYNDAVDLLSSRLDLLATLVETPSEVREQRRILTRMLRQLPYFIEGTGKLPKREKDVQDHLHMVIRMAFPDVIREVPIPKQTKTYYPDFGVASVDSAIEVKFVGEPSKAALAIGSLYEDMKGYAASGFSYFIGLVYMTGNYLTQDQVNAELGKVGTPKSWKVYLVVGQGAAKAKLKTVAANETK